MACFHPIEGFTAPGGGITWSPPMGYKDLRMVVPCGRCVGCRIDRVRDWSARMMHEASLHDENCFITLTYNDEHLPKPPTLVKSHFQDFMKRFRRSIEPKQVSYFMCGEYGESNGRPHYHAIIFGYDFGKKVYRGSWGVQAARALRQKKVCNAYSSEELSKLWTFGYSVVGSVTNRSCAYVAAYCMKRITGPMAEKHYERIDQTTGEVYHLLPEYACMSTRPAIGKRWFARFGNDVLGYDAVITGGKLQKVPRYYDKLRAREGGKDLGSELYNAKLERKLEVAKRAADSTPERLAVREEVAIARKKLFSKRDL